MISRLYENSCRITAKIAILHGKYRKIYDVRLYIKKVTVIRAHFLQTYINI